MRFIITRTSRYIYSEENPCDGATKEKIFTDWKEPVEVTAWFKEINTLEELLAFIKKNGQIVIGKSYQNKKYLEIEIYDDYRE